MSIFSWSTTPVINATIDGHNIAENCSPAGINDAMRSIMADVIQYVKDTGGALATAGAANTYTVTTNATWTAYADGQSLVVQINATNTGAATLNVDALGAKAIKKYTKAGVAAVDADDLQSAGVYPVAYDATGGYFVLVGQTLGAISGAVVTVDDDEFTIQDNADQTKQAVFQLSGITTGTTRTFTLPDADETLVGKATTDTLTNKSIDLTSNTLAATSLQLKTALTDETGSGAAVFAESPTLVTPALGTPASGVGTNLTGTGAGFTAGNVTTNANLTGHVTSVGNAAVLGSFTSLQLKTALTNETGSGAAVFGTSPTLVTPALGTPASGVMTNATGTAAGLTSGNVTTNANLTGHVTSVGNAAVLGSFTSAQLAAALTNETGSGSAVFSTSPTLVTPALGTPASGVATNLTGTAASLTSGNVTTNANLTGHVTSVGNSAVLGAFSHAQLNTAVTDATIVSTGATQTLTNKTFDANGTGNSLSNVDIADLAAGTDGELITWDAAGAPAAVPVGTINHVLTSNGAGAAPTFQAGGSGSMDNVVEDTTPQLGGDLDGQGFDVNIGSLNGGQLGGSRNLLINSRGAVNQREYVSGTATTGGDEYTVDQWRVVTLGQNLAWTETEGTKTFTAPAGGVEQKIEGLNIHSGTFVIGWTGTATCTVDGVAKTTGGTFTLTGGTNCTVKFSGGTFSLPQIEGGSTATPFEHESYGVTLAKCQRFCVQMNDSQYLVIGFSDSTSICETSVALPVEMRTGPSLETSGAAGDYAIRAPTSNITCTSEPIILGSGGKNIAGVRFRANGLLTSGQANYCYGNSGGFLRFLAELV